MSNSKLNASIEAIKYIKPKIDFNSIIGVGTGSTVNYFIEELAKIKNQKLQSKEVRLQEIELLLDDNVTPPSLTSQTPCKGCA